MTHYGHLETLSQRLNNVAYPVVIGGTTYAQYVVPQIHDRIGTQYWYNATVGSLQQRILTHATSDPIHSCYGGDHTPTQHNRNDG
jgi:hypothetical protein